MIQLSDRTKNKIAGILKRYTEEEIRRGFRNRSQVFNSIFEKIGKSAYAERRNIPAYAFQCFGYELLIGLPEPYLTYPKAQ